MTYQAEPPEGGELEIAVEMAPVSLQASRKKKDTISSAIRHLVADTGYILSGEVEIVVEWSVHERIRYETLESPDVDNVLKVTLDALCGPFGVLVNDCQVQSVVCRWIDWTRSDHSRIPASEAMNALQHIQHVAQLRREIAAQTGDWYAGQSLMPVQQFFHVGRLRGFVIITADELLEELGCAT